MQRRIAREGRVHGAAQRRVRLKRAVLDGSPDARELLVDDAPRAKIHVAHLGVAHLALRKPDIEPRARHQGVRGLLPQPVPVGCMSGHDGVVFGGVAVPPAVQHDQHGGTGRDTHRWSFQWVRVDRF